MNSSSLFNISAPPVPVRKILQSPLPGMWDEVDVSQDDSALGSVSSPYSPQTVDGATAGTEYHW
ncbi:MAG: hypothetical protein IPK17_05050 [Chloroflexi bacterium]|uniref:hypothetical protein n=1 Tax=Candidatus Flexifilum breve TaxID=3140694 RepID=UPI003134897F|nr:hypothetical protein [Chloroflexota bacterium]